MVKKETVLEKLLNIIPGFHGYRAKEKLRKMIGLSGSIWLSF